MNEQYEKSLTKLELDKVLAMLSDHAASQAAKERCLAIRPSTDADEIRHLLDETSAACACITVKGSPSFGGLYDVGASLDRADRRLPQPGRTAAYCSCFKVCPPDKSVFRRRREKRTGVKRAGCVLPADHHE